MYWFILAHRLIFDVFRLVILHRQQQQMIFLCDEIEFAANSKAMQATECKASAWKTSRFHAFFEHAFRQARVPRLRGATNVLVIGQEYPSFSVQSLVQTATALDSDNLLSV